MEARYTNVDNDPRGPWKPGDLSARNPYSAGRYKIICPSGRVIPGPPPGTYWRYSEENFKAMDKDGRIWWGENGDNVPVSTAPDPSVRVRVDMSLKVQAIESAEGGLKAFDMHAGEDDPIPAYSSNLMA